MNVFQKIVFLLALCLLVACTDETNSSSSTTTTTTSSDQTKPDKTSATKPVVDLKSDGTKKPQAMTTSTPKSHNCKPSGTVLEDNTFWAKDANTLICVMADSTTNDTEFGDSHRVLEIYDTKDCKLITRKTLPVNISPDYHYYLESKTYTDKNKIVGIPGIDFIFLYDVENKKLIERLDPKFLNKREAMDAQSGTPMGMESWENYILGFAKDLGGYCYNDKLKPVLPVAEYLNQETAAYHSLFLLNDGNGKYMAIFPTIDADGFRMELKTIFKTAENINPTIDKNVRDNRFIILRKNNGDGDAVSRLAIDMKKMTQVFLPKNIANQKAKEVLTWIKKNVK